MERLKVVIDVDGGLESLIGLALALRAPELEIIGISTVSGSVAGKRVINRLLLANCSL